MRTGEYICSPVDTKRVYLMVRGTVLSFIVFLPFGFRCIGALRVLTTTRTSRQRRDVE